MRRGLVQSRAVSETSPPSSGSRSGADTVDDSSAPEASVGAGLGWLAGPLCLVLLAGLAMPPYFGLAMPLLLALLMTVVGQRRVRRIVQGSARLSRASPGVRASVLVALAGSAAVLLTVATRAVGALLVAHPAALWGAGAAVVVALVLAVVGPLVPARARPVLLLLLAVTVPAAGVLGTRYEAAGSDARGWAHSGPILGIHPFQITSIMVDGEGPFDLPINDYVEPDGSRGYGPEALADALDRALHDIAERTYSDGPARIRRALIDAEVEAVVTPAVYERLDREPIDQTQPRLWLRSGSFGPGSRIEMVCPGRRIDPRGPQGESVMNRMCPDKYAAEASAGLGVTGRWSGYSEARGNARLGLFRLRGWTRGPDAEGLEVVEKETRLWAWLLLGLVGLLRARPAARVGDGLRGVAGALGAIAVVLVVVAAFASGRAPAVGAWSAGPSWHAWTEVWSWTPALALGGLGLFALDVADPASLGGRRAAGVARAVAVPAVLVVVATLALAASLPALQWAFPVHGRPGATLPTFVQGLAEAVGERWGLTIFEIEGALASTVAVLLLGGAVATVGAGLGGVRRLFPAAASRPLRLAAAVGIMVLVAAALVVSRKTAGASALMPGVIGMTLVLGSALTRISSPGRPSISSTLVHLGWVAGGLALVLAAVAPLPSHWFVTLCTAAGVIGVLAAGLIPLLDRRSTPVTTTLENAGS